MAKNKHFLIADDDDDEETAMATVNTEITVTSNASAVVTPMFVDGANGVSVMEGDNMPFSYVDWGLKQSGVLAGEATFMIQRTAMGANQEMEPTGDVAYVTCGPFNCAEGMDAPELSVMDSAVCNGLHAGVHTPGGLCRQRRAGRGKRSKRQRHPPSHSARRLARGLRTTASTSAG